MTADDQKDWSTIQVSNLPLETSRRELEEIFSDNGPIKKCFVLKPREGKSSTIGYVTFAMTEDCKSTVGKTEGYSIGGNDLGLKLAPNKKIWGEKPTNEVPDSISKKKARLVIRNLSFQADEKSLRSFVEPFGKLKDIKILKKPDGKMVGCAFVEYSQVSEAAVAVKKMNAKQFLGRTVAVDWAVPKEVFKSRKVESAGVKESQVSKSDDRDSSNTEEKEETEEEESDDEEENMDVNPEEQEDVAGDDGDSAESEYEAEESKPTHNLSTGHDIGELKTVFIRNLSYESAEEDLFALMEDNFGKVMFAKLVMDKKMGHPKGTAFVKFRNSEDATKCVEVGEGDDGIFLDGRRLGVLLAQEKNEVEKARSDREKDKKQGKDSRNLYLAREGIIREGTLAADGVSPSDMLKRKQVEKQKRNLLKNLNMFVSPNRLCVRNLPPNVDDSKLKSIFSKEVKKGAKITEAKVMKQFGQGEPVSKEYGFISFMNHEDALQALRNLNNNPSIFTAEKRPIVEFSIENRKVLLARQKRLEKSKENNPNITDDVGRQVRKIQTKNKAEVGNVESKTFTGMSSDPKQKGLPMHSGAKVRTNRANAPKISRKALRKQELERKNPKLRKRKIENTQEIVSEAPDPKKSKKEQRKSLKKSREALKEAEKVKKFNSMVAQHRSILSNNVEVRKKWFDT